MRRKPRYTAGYSKQAEHTSQTSPDTSVRRAVSSLIVRPRVPQVGPGFVEAVLGQKHEGVALTHVVTTHDQTVFNVETSNEQGGQYSLGAVALRTAVLLNNPDMAPVLLEQSFYDYEAYRKLADNFAG